VGASPITLVRMVLSYLAREKFFLN